MAGNILHPFRHVSFPSSVIVKTYWNELRNFKGDQRISVRQNELFPAHPALTIQVLAEAQK